MQKFAKASESNSTRKVIRTKQGHSIECLEQNAARSKAVSDLVDLALGRHYRLTPDELDFIINYDIKYRMGQDDSGEDED